MYMAIQNIFESTAFAGWSGCPRGISTIALNAQKVKPHIPALKHPEARAVLVHLVPETQPHQRPPRDVPHGPEVEREEHHHQDGLRAGSVLDSKLREAERSSRKRRKSC